MSGIEELATTAVDCGFHLHKELGPGLLESVYETLLAHALRERGLSVERQRPIPMKFRGISLNESLERTLSSRADSSSKSNRSSATYRFMPSSCSHISD